MTDSVHAPFAPSASPSWGHCSGYIKASSGFPDVETDEKRAGTAAHWVVSSQLLLFLQTGAEPDLSHLLGSAAPNGVVIDEEMLAAAQIMIDDVLKITNHGQFMVEQRVHMPQVHQDCWGTFDCAYFCVQTQTLYVWDFKYGHRSVIAKEHFQFILYTLGLMNLLNITRNVKVVISVVAPRSYNPNGPVNRWETYLYDLAPYVNKLQLKAHESINNPKLTVGKHCRDCPAVAVCSAARKANYSIMSYVDEAYSLDQMSDADLGYELEILEDALKVVEARRDALLDMVKYKIQEGSVRTGWALGAGKSKWVWSAPDTAIKSLADSFGIEAEKKSLITPAQFRDKLKKDDKKVFLDHMLDSLARKQAGGAKLIPASETLGARVFGRGE